MSTPSNAVPGSPSNRKEPRLRLSLPAGACTGRCGANCGNTVDLYRPLAAAAVFLLAFLTALTLSPSIGTNRSTDRTNSRLL